MRRSISRRLLFITIGLVSLAVAFAGAVLLRQHLQAVHRGFEGSAVVLARVVAEHAVGPLVFEDRGGAAEILAKTERSAFVDRAILYDRRSRPVAVYERPGSSSPLLPPRSGPATVYDDQHLHVFEPLFHHGVQEGVLYLTASTASVRREAAKGTLLVLAVVLVAIAGAAALAGPLQRSITRPVLRLAETMRGMTGETILSTQVEDKSSDEASALYDGFNRMMDQLAARQRERDRTEARLLALIAALPDPVFVLDQSGRIVDVLARTAPVTLLKEELRGRPIAAVVAPDQCDAFEAAILQALAQGGPQRLAYEAELRETRRWFDAVLVPIAGPTGEGPNQRLVLFVPRDVSERHVLERDLRQAQKMEALGRLAGGVAHDFNNILTAILGYADMLARDLEGTGRAADNAKEILRAADRAGQLTRQLLAFSRRRMVAQSRVCLNELVIETQRLLRPIIGEDIDVQTDLGEDLPAVLGEVGQLQQVLLNLAINAREAMPKGGTLTVRTRTVIFDARRAGDPELGRGSYVLLEVSDTGVGMSETVRARIFEPFFTTKGTKGTGLGLALVYGIVRQAGGDVTASSDVGRGTTFRIYLPVAPAPGESRTAEVERAPAPQTRGHGTILIAEDETQIRELALKLLRDQGYDLLVASDGQEALGICRAHSGPIDVLLTDVIMPHMSGPDLVAAALPLHPEMRVLYMSGYTDSEVVLRGVAVEQVPFLPKPFTPDELCRKIQELTSEEHARAAPGPPFLSPAAAKPGDVR